ncbi:MAG: DNA polymerase II [Pseudomonadota bacterium]
MKGFILTRHWRDTPQGIQLELWLATDSKPLRLIIPHQHAVCFFRERDSATVDKLLTDFPSAYRKALALKNVYGEPVMALYCLQQRLARDLCEQLVSQGITLWESDIKPVNRFLMERFITAGVEITAAEDHQPLPPKRHLQIQTSQLKPCEYQPTLQQVSLDIETSMDARDLYSIAVYGGDYAKVFMVTDTVDHSQNNKNNIDIVWCESVKQCLQHFLAWLQDSDPDVIIGWHVVQFDLWVLSQLCQQWQVEFTLGRDRQSVYWREDSQHADRRYIQVPGRVVLDGIELLRMAFYHFERFTLQHVAGELLGESKFIQQDNRAGAIAELFQQDKVALAEYNLQDCELVWRIFEKTQLLEFAIARAKLTGLAMDRAGGSVASFEYAYLPHLHRAGYVAPNLGELDSDIVSPGGYVMRSKPGLYQHVLVLDFKSLYPSIIRSFHIDPYGFWYAQHQQLGADDIVDGFNGAYFSRDRVILPHIIESLWAAREQAKARDNKLLAQAIKIIMNSFYGVLGSTGCRFFDPRIASSITLRGHDIIQRSRDWIIEQGYDVIYGDTDSVFVWLGNDIDNKTAVDTGQQLAQGLNQWWTNTLANEFTTTSYLEIEFETHYRHFLMPTIRGSNQGSKKRYAGMIQYQKEDRIIQEMVFKGLETVRADWTQLAKAFQQELFRRVFSGQPYADYLRQLVGDLLRGQSDDLIIYRKRLKRPLVQYRKSNPPHIKAAKKLAQMRGRSIERGEAVDYIITVNGPEPVDYLRSQIDYQHYIDKQLKPIANSILNFLDDDFDSIIDQQLMLF